MLEVILVSICAGILGSLLGLGGGFIIVPTLTIMGMTPSQIAATSLFSVLSTSSSSTIAYVIQRKINYKLVSRLSLTSIPGSIMGAYISKSIELNEFKIYFGFILLAASIYLLIKNKLSKPRSKDRYNYYIFLAYVASFFAGIISSLFGIGGGIIYMPLMIGLLSLQVKESTATTQFIIAISSLTGLLTHLSLTKLDYSLILMLVIGTFIGAQIGARISIYIKEILLRRMVAIALIIIAINMILSSLYILQ